MKSPCGSAGPSVSGVVCPSAPTLAKYGLTYEAWRDLIVAQGGACQICRVVPGHGRLCIDHDHVKGWKKLSPERRARHVRGILCWRCNTTFVGRGITLGRARNVVAYLEAYDNR